MGTPHHWPRSYVMHISSVCIFKDLPSAFGGAWNAWIGSNHPRHREQNWSRSRQYGEKASGSGLPVTEVRSSATQPPPTRAEHRSLPAACGNFIVLAISSAGVCLLRSNGWMAFAVILVIGIFVLGRKHIKTIIIMAAVFIAAMAVRGPLFNALGIAKPDILESLAIPMQQIARVLSEGEEITDEQRETLSNIANLDMIAEKYRWDTVDTFKNDIRNTGDVGYIEEHKKELLGLYIEMAKQHPVTFVEAWIDQTKGYWNGGYEFWNWTVVNENRFGIERVTKDRKAEQILTSYADSFNRIYPLQLFISIGLCTWMTVMLAAGGIAGRRKEALLTVPGIVLVLTLMIATPISCEFRYAYALFTAFPAIFCGIMQKR